MAEEKKEDLLVKDEEEKERFELFVYFVLP